MLNAPPRLKFCVYFGGGGSWSLYVSKMPPYRRSWILSDLQLQLGHQRGDCASPCSVGCDCAWCLPVVMRVISSVGQIEMVCEVRAQSGQSATA